jgi:hypothetical protein
MKILIMGLPGPRYYDYRINEKDDFPWTKILADKI